MPAAVNLREDFSAGELRALARRSKDRSAAGGKGVGADDQAFARG
jgi:hypothetical protein